MNTGIDPLGYLSGRMSRETYLQRFLPEYETIRYANAELPPNSAILCIFLGNRRYYFEREVNFDYFLLEDAVKITGRAEAAAAMLKARGFTHLMLRHDLFNVWLENNFAPEDIGVLRVMLSEYTRVLFSHSGYTLVELR